MIEISNLGKYFGDNKILHNINLKIEQNEIFAIVGHSGAGKSTLLRCINGLEKYDEGELRVFGQNIGKMSEQKLRYLRKDIGMIFQHFSLLEQKSVYENTALPMQLWGYKKSDIDKKTVELLNLVGLIHKKNSYPKELSGGEKQRVAIARALTLEPKILLSDEATSALDPKTTMSILDLLKTINKTLGITVVLVTHEMSVVKNAAKRALLLENGQIIGLGEIEQLFLKPDERMRKFLGEEDILPNHGVNIRLYFPSTVSDKAIVTAMARELNIDFNIVWGRLEKLGESVVGSLVINVDSEHVDIAKKYLQAKTDIFWEIIQ
ncbi:MAG: methionine ABC transporter ATP-binding protein [Campylobacteraceae bacterium]|nr:methionine ABC transporter ATP-binding protein [Campylobacteraceae bacterium]